MYAPVACSYCGRTNVVEIAVDLGINERALHLSDITIKRTLTLEEFYDAYKEFMQDFIACCEFPVRKELLIKKIRRYFNCTTALAYDILDRIKNDLCLYEKNGMIYEVL